MANKKNLAQAQKVLDLSKEGRGASFTTDHGIFFVDFNKETSSYDFLLMGAYGSKPFSYPEAEALASLSKNYPTIRNICRRY